MAVNLHGTALVIGDRGVFIRGGSGTGKTRLALELLARSMALGRYGRLVSDDQVFTSSCGGQLVMAAPSSIAGLVEVWGLGPRPIGWQAKAVIDLVVTLVDPEHVERLPEPALTTLQSVSLPELILAERGVHDAASAVMAQLGIGLFDAVHMRQNG